MMTGYQSKRAAALDEDGMYLVHQTAHPKPAQQKTVAWIEKDMQCDDFDPDSVTCEKPARAADGWEWIPLYTTPPAVQRPWVGLTDADCKGMSAGDRVVAMWADRTLKEKNNG